MKRVLAGAGLVVVVLLLTASASRSYVGYHEKTVCRRGRSDGRHWRRITADLSAEIYVIHESGEKREVFGCVYGKHPYRLGEVGGEDAVERFVLNGNVVAFYELVSPRDAGFADFFVKVADLRARKKIYTAPTGTLVEPRPEGVRGTGPATAIVVKPDGSVGWISENQEEEAIGGHYYQVHALDRNGERLLDSGVGVAPKSLALAGSTIYWTDEGKPESASLE